MKQIYASLQFCEDKIRLLIGEYYKTRFNIIKLEDLETREIRYLKKDDLDFETKENDILILGNNGYYKDEKLKNDRINILKEKLERLKNSQFKEWIFLYLN